MILNENLCKTKRKSREKKRFSRSIDLSLRGQTVHWIGEQLDLCLILDSRDKTLNWLQEKWIPFTKLPWIPSTNTYNVKFVSILVLARFPQRANIAN